MGFVDLQQPLRSLVPSLDSSTLAVLAGTETGLGTSRIRQLAGRGSWAGHQKVLDRLVRHGLVLSEPTNNGFVYRLNRRHLLAPAVLSAVQVRQELFARLTAAVVTLRPAPEHASVFGSFARGQGADTSDIDLFLLMPDGYDSDTDAWNEALQGLEDDVLAWTGNRLEVLVLDRSQLREATAAAEPVLASLRGEAVTVYGPEVNTLLASGARR